MDTKLFKDEHLKIIGDHKEMNFIDLYSVGYESMAVDLYPNFYYIEIRRKANQLRIFTFPKKSYKKECDFGWWEDAEVVFALNNKTEVR